MVKLADIKIKQKSNIKIKKFNKAQVYTQKLKNNIVNVKEKSDYTSNNNEESTPTEYGANQITEKTNILAHRSANKFNEYGKKSVRETKENIEKTTQKIKKKTENKNIKKNVKKIKEDTKNMKKTITNVPKTTKNTIKSTQILAKDTMTGTKKIYQITKIKTQNVIKDIKKGVKTTISSVKAIIASTKALITLILAGGWIAIFIIVLICLIGLICSSVLGIFFSNENKENTKTFSSVISEINTEYINKITEIQNTIEHDDYEINSNRAEWKDVISIYAVIVTNGDKQSDIITLNNERIEKLKSIFWEMNTISSEIENVEKEIETTDEDGNTYTEKVTRKVLYINITSKSVDEMADNYNFNSIQKEQLAELQKTEYNSAWSNVLYGSSIGSSDIVQVAYSQIGNVGGKPYWSWYGFKSRVEWCACFVSCAPR